MAILSFAEYGPAFAVFPFKKTCSNILSFILIKSVEKYSFRFFAAFKSFFVPVFNTLISDFIMSSCWMIVSLNISSIEIS